LRLLSVVSGGTSVTSLLTMMSLGLAFRGLSICRPLMAASSSPLSMRIPRATIHLSPIRRDLYEFFETEKNRGEQTVRVGREWRKDELRIKSNQDLHKLWYVLLKERNMLLTMEHAFKEEWEAMPNPERIDKVEESMENLESVVRERNRAFHQLEAGVAGEREREYRKDWTGRVVAYKPLEHAVPLHSNPEYRRELRFKYKNMGGEDVKDFQRRYRERLHNRDLLKQLKEMRRAARVVRRFPDVSIEALEEKFPLVDYDLLMRWKKIRGYSLPKTLQNI